MVALLLSASTLVPQRWGRLIVPALPCQAIEQAPRRIPGSVMAKEMAVVMLYYPRVGNGGLRAGVARADLLAREQAHRQHEPGARRRRVTNVRKALKRDWSSCQGIGRFLLRP